MGQGSLNMKSYVNPVHLVTTRDGVCPDGHVEVLITMGGESATEFLLNERIRVLDVLGADFHRYRDKSEARIRELEAAGHGLSGCLKVLFLRVTMPEGVEMALLAWQKAIAPQSETKGDAG